MIRLYPELIYLPIIMNFKQAILSNRDDSDSSRIYDSESTIIKYNDDDSQVSNKTIVNDIKATNNNNVKQNMKFIKEPVLKVKNLINLLINIS